MTTSGEGWIKRRRKCNSIFGGGPLPTFWYEYYSYGQFRLHPSGSALKVPGGCWGIGGKHK